MSHLPIVIAKEPRLVGATVAVSISRITGLEEIAPSLTIARSSR